MKYNFYPKLLLRIPAFSFVNNSLAKIEQLCQSDFFKAAIYLTSRSLYLELEKQHFIFGKLNDKQKTTVLKYLNRICFRPTPFGIFSSFSLAGWSSDATMIRFDEKGACLHLRLDFAVSLAIERKISANGAINRQFGANQSVYRVIMNSGT